MLPGIALTLLGLVSASNAAVTKRSLSHDDVVLLGKDGVPHIMKAAEFDALETRPAAPAPFKSSRRLRRQDCDESSEVQVTSEEEFLNWDVAISPIVSAASGKAMVMVTSGHSLSNAITIGSSVKGSILDVIELALSVDYSRTWTTTEMQSLTFEVPAGQHGLVVSQPYVRRVQGNYLDGCNSDWKKTPFVSDVYESESHGDFQWVKGIIRLCNSTEYPIPYCMGEGSHK